MWLSYYTRGNLVGGEIVKKFAEWVLRETTFAKYAPNKRFFEISPEWGNWSYYVGGEKPNETELELMRKICEKFGFPAKVTKSGGQWDGENADESVLDKWHEATDEGFAAVKRYREIVYKRKIFMDPMVGKRIYYNEKLDRIQKTAAANPDMGKKIFLALDLPEQWALTHDAEYFNEDGLLTDEGKNAARVY